MKISKYILLFLMLCVACGMQAQVMMHVHATDGTTRSIPLDLIENVTFGEREIPELNNEYQHKDAVFAIGKITVMQRETDYIFSVYSVVTAEGEVNDPLPAYEITLSADSLGKTINLSTADKTDVAVTSRESGLLSLQGTLKVNFDKFKNNVTIALNAMDAGYELYRVKYFGTYAHIYAADNRFQITPAEGADQTADLVSVFRMKPAEVGASVGIAFADVSATDVAGMCQGQHAVWFTIAASKFNTTLDLATDVGSYTFKYIDYATGLVCDEVLSGTLTTAQITDNTVYFKFVATLSNGVTLEADYFGTVSDVESMDEMIPNPVLPNMFTFYNADGEVNMEAEVVVLKHKLTWDGYHKLYFMPIDGTTSAQSSPQVQFPADMINAGNIDLSALEPNIGFSVDYMSLQMASPDDKYMGYKPVPDNGVFNVSYDEITQTYSVYLEVTNSYTMSGIEGGDHSKLVVSFKGVAEEM